MKESYFDKVWEVLRKCDEENINIYANVYDDGENEGEEILVIGDTETSDKLDELFKPIVKEICEANGDIFRDYSGFSLDYITGDQWTFSDEGYTCSDCGKFYRYNNGWGGSYSEYFLGDGFIICENCVRENYIEEYLEDKINIHNHANTILTNKELKDVGFEKVNDYAFANGLYSGENDSPEKILGKAKELYPNCEFLFSIVKDYNPFHTEFDLWKREIVKEEIA